MDSHASLSKILYYCREKYYGKMRDTIKECLVQNPSDSTFAFLGGVSLMLNAKYQESIRELNAIDPNDEDVSFPVSLCLVHAHKKLSSDDVDTVDRLETRLRSDRKRANPTALYYSALVLFSLGRPDKANDVLEKLLKMDPDNTRAVILKGRVDIVRQPNNLTQKLTDTLEAASAVDDLEGSLCLVTLKYAKREHAVALAILGRLQAKYPSLEGILSVEVLKNEVSLRNWDRVLEIAEQLSGDAEENLFGEKYKILYLVCKKGDYIEAADVLNKYYTLLGKQESENADLFYDTARLFSYACGRSDAVLTQTYDFVKYAAELQPSNVNYLTELGRQCCMRSKYKDAVHFFRSATKVDDNSVDALCGLTLCQLSEGGPSEQIEQQIELLYELTGGSASEKHPLLLLMSAKMETGRPERAVKLLNEVIGLQTKKYHFLPYGCEYLKAMNCDFLLDVVEEYLKFVPKKPLVVLDAVIFNFEDVLPATVSQILLLLESVVEACPGLVSALYKLAKVRFLFGENDSALHIVQELTENVDQTYADAHLLLSQIHVRLGQFGRAEQSLEACLSYNFKIRDNPMYHLLKGVICKSQNRQSEALSCYLQAMSLTSSKSKTTKPKVDEWELALPDKTTLYLELINTHTLLGQHAEAEKIMQNATEEFSYTTEEARLTIANAELSIYKGDVDHAIELLSQIGPGQPYYLQAHSKLAHVYLKEKNDRGMFADCFREVVNNHPGSDSHTMLGDAYLSINEPRLAVEAFEKAIEQNPKDLTLVKKMGVALVKMHLYRKAEKYYTDAIEALNNPELTLDLAALYLKLRMYDKAEELLRSELDRPSLKNATDYMSLKLVSKLNTKLAEVKERNVKSDKGGLLAVLKEARENQSRVVKRAQLDSRPDLEEENKTLSEICSSLATHYLRNKAVDQAIQTYKEALQYVPQHPDVLLSLSKLYMQVNEADLCQQTCSILLSADPENEGASVMMADLAFGKVDFETASFHLKQLLTARPTHWMALERLIDVQRRLGDLDEVLPFMTKAQETGHSHEPGYLYCAGLHARYNGDPNAALRHWGRARQAEGQWGQSAALGVIKVCLSPGGEALPPPLSDDSPSDYSDDSEDTRSFALGMAERLLNELQANSKLDSAEAMELKLLGYRLSLAKRKKSLAEATLKSLLQTATEDGGADDIGVAVVIASTYMVLKQLQRARNQLKRFARVPWSPERAEWLEICWVLLAECFLNSGNSANNVESARECIERVLKHNKSCMQAHEYLGYLCEKDQSHKQAAQHYESAWKYGGQANASIGYKYAVCLLKAKKYAEAIMVSRDVLIAHPDCPKIRKEVMEKATALLRT